MNVMIPFAINEAILLLDAYFDGIPLLRFNAVLHLDSSLKSLNIANKFLLPKALKENGVKEGEMDLQEGTFKEIIMKIHLATDHAGLELKNTIKTYLLIIVLYHLQVFFQSFYSLKLSRHHHHQSLQLSHLPYHHL